jgi:hypothetical protein
LGLIAAVGGGEAIEVVGSDGEGAEVGVRRRHKLRGDEGNDGDRATVMDWCRGGVVELRRGVVKLSRWSFGAMGGSRWELRGDQCLAGEEEGAAVVFRGSRQVESRRESGMGREGAGEALELEKRGRRGVHGRLLFVVRWRSAEQRGGVARAREGQGGGARAVLWLGATRGGEGSRRWRRGGPGAAVSGANGRRQRNRAGE